MIVSQMGNIAKRLVTQGIEKKFLCNNFELLGSTLKELANDTVQINSFTPFKTIKDAIKYSREALGIKKFNISNLDMANYTLQGLTRVKMATGTDLGITKVLSKNIIIHPITGKPCAFITGMMDVNSGILTLSENAMRRDFASKISKLAMLEPKNMKEYFKLLTNISEGNVPLCEIMQRFKNLNFTPRNIDDLPNQTVFHELWHRLHFLNCQKLGIDFSKLGKPEELAACKVKDTRFIDEFFSPEIQKIISDYKFLGDYAKTSPCEFIAEVGSVIASNIKPPQKIMNLYYKYGGPKINI